MKRTPFKPKPYKWKVKPYNWKRKPKKKGKELFAHLKKESKTEEWNRIRAEQKLLFLKAGIISCELKLEGCTRAYNFGWTWSFAHSLKRDKMSSELEIRYVQMREIVYACGRCHNIIEKIGNKERFDGKPKMKDYVRNAIANRQNPLTNPDE